jgi:hypothetical protein
MERPKPSDETAISAGNPPTDENRVAAGEPPRRVEESSDSQHAPRPAPRAQKCPQCRLVNPPDAQRCDCGWDFMSQRQEKSFLEPKRQTSQVRNVVGVGAGIVAAILVFRIILRVFFAADH